MLRRKSHIQVTPQTLPLFCIVQSLVKRTWVIFFPPSDRELIQELDAKVKEDRKSASPKSLYNAGTFLWLLGRNDKAREYTERMIKISNGSREVSSVSEWPLYKNNTTKQGILCVFVVCDAMFFFFFSVASLCQRESSWKPGLMWRPVKTLMPGRLENTLTRGWRREPMFLLWWERCEETFVFLSPSADVSSTL